MTTKRRPKMKLSWWVLSRYPPASGGTAPVHAFREGRHKAICGGLPQNDPETGETTSYEVKGPKSLVKHPVCQRCAATLERMGVEVPA